jgi:hypothetical protein
VLHYPFLNPFSAFQINLSSPSFCFFAARR